MNRSKRQQVSNFLKIDPALWKVITQAIYVSVNNLAVPTEDGNAGISPRTLKVVLFLLELHPNVLVRKRYVESIQQLLAGKQISWTPEQLSAMQVLQVSENPRSATVVLDEVLDIILEYGESVEQTQAEKRNARKRSQK